MRVFVIILFSLNACYSQTINECKKRFDTYLNYKGSLNNLVKFENESIVVYNSKGQKEFTAQHHEIPLLAYFFENCSSIELQKLYKQKANKIFTKQQRDSISHTFSLTKKAHAQNNAKKLNGIKIAIDAGHLASSFTEAMSEQKFLYFLRDSVKSTIDTVKLYEAELTFKTAVILKNKLEEQGAIVLLTRPRQTESTFGCCYSYWFQNYKQKTLDSLLLTEKLDQGDYKKLINLPEYNFFWDFFRDYELVNRARLINEFKPDITLIIHYNVDEKNIPWKKTTTHDFTMAFIGGCYTADRLDKMDSKMNFMRLLFTKQLNESEKLGKLTVEQFHEKLKIPIASVNDADYLKNSCITLNSHGVYSRQLILCNRINSPLIYGESLYQDNVNESKWLMDNNKIYNGIKTNERVYLVAESYYHAVMAFFTK